MADAGGTVPSITHGPIAVYVDPVLGRPFTSRFRERRYVQPPTADARPVEELTGVIHRDRQGRKRIDVNIGVDDGQTVTLTTIWDVVAGRSYVFSSMSPLVQATTFGKPETMEGALPPPIETERINNVLCRVVRISELRGPASIDTVAWASDELRHPVKQETRSSGYLAVWELIDPEEGDPDPAVFAIDEQKFQVMEA